MSNIITYSWTDTNGTEWDATGYFNKAAGAATADPYVQGNVGWHQSGAGSDKIFQSTQRISTRDHKARMLLTWADALTVGRYGTLALRLTDTGANGYWAKLDSNTGTPTLTIYRRRNSTDTSVATQDLTVLSGAQKVLAADLEAGVTLWLRVETVETGVRVMAAVDTANAALLDLDDYQIDTIDTASSGVQSGGTWGILTDGNCVQDDVTYDTFVAMDFEDEADPIPVYAEGLGLRVNGNYYDEDGMVALGLSSLDVLQSYASGGAQVEAKITDIHDYHRPALSAGDVVEILYDGLHYARGVVRPISHQVTGHGDQNSYEVYGPKMLAREVVLSHPTTKAGTISFNLDSEHPQYDEARADLTLGEILQWVLDNHAEGEDGLRAHGAAPADSGLTVYDSIPADLLSGPVIPGFTVSGTVITAVETILQLMPKFGLRVDPTTLKWYFDDRPAGTEQELRTSALHMDWSHKTQANLARTVAFIRGGEPEVDWQNLTLGTGDIEAAWDTALGLEGETDDQSAHKYLDEGTVATFGVGGPSDGIYDTHLYVTGAGLSDMIADEWKRCTLLFTSGVQSSNGAYGIMGNTAGGKFWLTKITPWRTGGPPTVGDSIRITGARGSVDADDGLANADNAFKDIFSAYKTTGGEDIATGKCAKIWMKMENPAGGLSNYPMAGKVYATGEIVTSRQTFIPNGLASYPTGRNSNQGGTSWNGCANMGGVDADIGDIEARVPVRQPDVPYVRVPTTGFRGDAYTLDATKWDGAGEPGIGDPGVMTPLVVDDPAFQYQSLQQADYILMADAMLEIWGAMPRMADIRISNVWHADFQSLGKTVTVIDDLSTEGGRDTYANLDKLLLVQVGWRWGPEGVSTTVQCGTMNTLSGVNLDGIRRLHADTSEQARIKEQMKILEEMHNCLRESAEGMADALGKNSNQPIAACNITYQHSSFSKTTSRAVPPNPVPVGTKLDAIQEMLLGILNDLTTKQDGTFWKNDNADGKGKPALMWTDKDGKVFEWKIGADGSGSWVEVTVDDADADGNGETTEVPGGDVRPTPKPAGGGGGPNPGVDPLPQFQKGFDVDPGIVNTVILAATPGVPGAGPTSGTTALDTDSTGGARPPTITKVSVPLANGGAGQDFFLADDGGLYLDGGDGDYRDTGAGDDDTLLAGGAGVDFWDSGFNWLDPNGDGYPENLLGGYEGFILSNKAVMEHRLLGSSVGATNIPARAGTAGTNEPGLTSFDGLNEYAPKYDTAADQRGYEPWTSNAMTVNNMPAGGLVGASMAQLGMTEDGDGDFGSGPGSMLVPGATIGAEGALYYSPAVAGTTAGHPDISELAAGDIVPARTIDTLNTLAGLLGLTVVDLAAPIGAVYTDGTLNYAVEPGGSDQFQELVAVAAGTGQNGGDWNFVPATYFVYASGKPSIINDYDAVGGVNIPAATPTTVPMTTTVHNSDATNYAGAATFITVQRDGNYLIEAQSTFVENAATATDMSAWIEIRSPAGGGAWVQLVGTQAQHSMGDGDKRTLPCFGTWVEAGGSGFDVRIRAMNSASPSVLTLASGSRLVVTEVS